MRSLNAHLAEPGGHGHLPFHPECPVCRSARLAGPLPVEPIISQRAQASVVAAVLALSAGGPAAGIAAADSPGGEGTGAPQAGDGPGQQAPGFDPGSEISLPNEIAPPPAPVAGGDDDSPGGPVEGEPQEGLRAPAAVAPAPQAGFPTAPDVAAPPATGAPAPETPDPATPEPTGGEAPTGDQGAAEHDKKEPQERPRPRERDLSTSAPAAPQAPVATAAPTPTGTNAAADDDSSIDAQPTAGAPGIPDGADSYTVRTGDSLWSIAKRLLDSGASTAEVAHEVHRLWQLNADRIGTGNPDLIMAGQTLRLR